jgi:dihydropteroate synthase
MTTLSPKRVAAARDHTLIMGVVNVTPDSFFDGGVHPDAEHAIAHSRQLVEDGAHILDIGGESSRPGAAPVDVDTELRRVLPVLEGLAEFPVALSVDTYHAETARRSLLAGAAMINDISSLQGDPAMAEVVAEARCSCVLMHMQGAPRTMQENPHYEDVVDDISAFFEERIAFAVGRGIEEDAIWLDPGFGFGKTDAHNLAILRRLDAFKQLGRPLLLGTSNKSTIGRVLDLPVADRGEGTAATVALAIERGVDAVRVHDVRAMSRVAKMADWITRGITP